MLLRVALLGVAAATLMFAQAPQPQYSVSGSVVNSVSGEGIRRAVVHLNGSGPQRDAFTDGVGRFEIRNVPAGRYVLTAERPGFIDPNRWVTSQNPTSVDVNGNSEPVTVKLSPQSTITGRITNDNGEPLQGIFVQATEEGFVEGRKTHGAMGQDSTDEDGTFEFDNLHAGRYFIRAGPGFDFSTPGRRFPDRVYLPVFFPAAPDRESAQPIEVSAGQTVTADFRIAGTRVYPVTGVTNTASHVSIDVVGPDGESIGLNGGSARKPGQWMILLPSGTWPLQATSVLPTGQNLFGQTTVRVSDRPVSGVSISMQPLATVPVHVIGDNGTEGAAQTLSPAAPGQMVFVGGPGARGVQLKLQDEESGRDFYASTLPDGGLTFYAVFPGKYRLVALQAGNACIDSVNVGGTDLSRDEYLVAEGGEATPIEVTLGHDCGSLSVETAANPPPSSSVVLTSDSRLFQPRTAPAANVSFGALPPGTYHLYEVPSLALEYTNPEVMRKYTAQDIVIEPGENKKVTLDRPAGESQ